MFKPLHNRLVVERLEAEQTTASGIIIPDTAKEKPQQGKVRSVGPGNRDKKGKIIPMEIKEGDVVLFAKYGGADVTIDGKEFMIMKDEDVLGIVENAKGSGKKGK